jgi:hypothetical protein
MIYFLLSKLLKSNNPNKTFYRVLIIGSVLYAILYKNMPENYINWKPLVFDLFLVSIQTEYCPYFVNILKLFGVHSSF